MLQTKENVVERINTLKAVKFLNPTKEELHSSRTMLSRAQRKERERYKEAVMKQRVKLNRDLSNINNYLKSVDSYNAYLQKVSVSTNPELLGPAPTVFSRPNVVIGRVPMRRVVRMPRRRSRRRRR